MTKLNVKINMVLTKEITEEMYKDVIQRGPEDTLVIYQHADGSRSSYTYDYISKQSDKLVETLKQSGLKKV